jgi:site-specific DNA recombinase
MRPNGPKTLRCAIYTRKSTDHNLDLEFNSLQAQREACEAYIKSQAHEGWRLVPDPFDDGAFSGASLDRPALQALMDRVRARQVDIIVVYKVDRLTRSLADFAELVELFDANSASFVSVTQSFNTTSSMGRLTLNVLLSFAQFEREVIGERVRDKIAASKKKGLWVGGPVPLGYKISDKKLAIIPDEAKTVRLIFALYLELGSVRLLTQELRRRGIVTKRQMLANGRSRGGGPFSVGALHHLLRNRFYIGEVCYRGGVYPGEHQPILDRSLFEAVQQKLANQAVERKVERSKSSALLTGLIFDDRGNRMTPSHANKRGVRYRYYVSQALLQGRSAETGSVGRVSATDVEERVLKGLCEFLDRENRGHGRNAQSRRPGRSSVRVGTDNSRQPAGGGTRGPTDDGIVSADPSAGRQIIQDHLVRVIVRPDQIDLTLRVQPISSDLGSRRRLGTDTSHWSPDAENGSTMDRHRTVDRLDRASGSAEAESMTIIIPWSAPDRRPDKGVIDTANVTSRPKRIELRGTSDASRRALLLAIARARAWIDDLSACRVASFAEIANLENKAERHIRFLAPLAFVSPGMVSAIASGETPADLTVTALVKNAAWSWIER